MPSANREVKTPDKFKCSLVPLYKLFVEIKGKMTEEHYEKLKETPFSPIFNAMLKLTPLVNDKYFEKTSPAVRKILNSYNSQTKKFVLGINQYSFEVSDVVELLGLPNKGIDIPVTYAQGKKALFENSIVECDRTPKLKKVIEEGMDREPKLSPSLLCSLLCIHLCCTFLLANSGGDVAWNLVKVFEDVDKIRDYNWAKAVHGKLMKSITAKNVFPSGCTVALLYWIGKMLPNSTKLTVPGDNVPGFANLNLEEICKNIIAEDFSEAQFCEGGASDSYVDVEELEAEVENLEAPLQSPDVEEYDSSDDCVIIGVTHPPQNVDVPSKPATCTNKGRKRKEITPRQSLSAAGSNWESGLRRSTRNKMRPLEYWNGERFLYGCIHSSPATVIGVKYRSPAADDETFSLNVKSFVSDEYKELVDQAALH